MKLLTLLGHLLDFIGGERSTSLVVDDQIDPVVTIRSDSNNNDEHMVVSCRKLMYLTTYERRWIPASKSLVFVVDCRPPSFMRAEFPEELFQTATFPMLSNWFLRDTIVPHMYAIHAYLDRFVRFNPKVTYSL